ncbi:auxin response factor 15-like isoform X1 [Canna indica]|uniref:Auxin response factor n=1 Tax=Canna indica TaxID=4628 RepID=A0AAQ3JM81_9LILI|nr:auxin response factor 15-like isoform X1 [Canna indica]
MDIDLNTIEEEEEEEPEHPTPQAAPVIPSPAVEDVFQSASVCLELWHACAGPRIWLPKKGSLVVYLPQGHLDHLGICGGGDGSGGRGGICSYDVPPHVFCRVVDIKLHADVATDEVYAQLSLVAESEDFERRLKKGEVEGDEEEEDLECINRASIPHMFCKTLTASDTSTHGGFSVPRRAAEDCFPPLDYKQQRPSQELVAKDLHGMEWRFRHIYRGQPRRHLLTTGWSAFVNRKKLNSGDAVLFLRGNDGVLRLGVRRATQSKSSCPVSPHQSGDSNLATVAVVANAVSTKKVFHINYNPRASSSEFIVPYWKLVKSLNNSISVGMRFKMLYESDDATERRSTGLITGISDFDPLRWPGSKWRCLLVNWDDDVDANRQNRISPWEIELTGSVLGSGSLSTGSKRAKISLPSVNMDFPIPNGNGCLDLRESASFHEVLQGQEFVRFRSPNSIGVAATHLSEIGNRQYSEGKPCSDANSCMIGESLPGGRVRIPYGNSDFSFNYTGFSESVRFQGVLQGQEVFSKNPPLLGARSDAHARNGVYGTFDGVRTSHAGSRLPAASMGYVTLGQPSLPSIQASSPSSVLMFQDASSKASLVQSVRSMNSQDGVDGGCYFAKLNGSEAFRRKEAPLQFWPPTVGYHFTNQQHKMAKSHSPVTESKLHRDKEQNVSQNGCRLFGFSLTDRIPEANLVDKTLPISPTSTEAKIDTAFSTTSSLPQMPAKPVGCSCTGVSALYALCAAPF